MKALLKPSLSVLLAYAVVVAALPRPLQAEEHVVPLGDVQARLAASAARRAQNAGDIQRVLSYPAAVEALRQARVSGEQVRAAVATLDDAELARLASQARASEKDVRAGLITGILALIGLIVVIVVVLALVADARPLPGDSPAA